jgi:hypothetical protein
MSRKQNKKLERSVKGFLADKGVTIDKRSLLKMGSVFLVNLAMLHGAAQNVSAGDVVDGPCSASVDYVYPPDAGISGGVCAELKSTHASTHYNDVRCYPFDGPYNETGNNPQPLNWTGCRPGQSGWDYYCDKVNLPIGHTNRCTQSSVPSAHFDKVALEDGTACYRIDTTWIDLEPDEPSCHSSHADHNNGGGEMD